MKTSKFLKIIFLPITLLLLQNCTLFNLPTGNEKSTLGESTNYTPEITNLPAPKDKIVVGVYKFRDQTGQYKAADNSASWSTAIPQGTTTILLKALEDSKWFTAIERENIGNLLNERQIIRSTRKEYAANDGTEVSNLPPLLFAGILLEGGVISYDTNVMTGGIGARYFGLGAGAQYRQDRITVYLRAVSTSSGEILKTVYTSKTILSTSINGNFFRFIDTERLLESDIGLTQNEPVHLAVTEAIEKAVLSLIVEGVKDGLWANKQSRPTDFDKIIANYTAEKKQNYSRIIGNKFPDQHRGKMSVFASVEAFKIKGDYKDAQMNIGGKIGVKYFLTNAFNLEANVSLVTLENSGILKEDVMMSEVNAEYLFLPKYKLSPFVYAGVGTLLQSGTPLYKAQAGGGLEYLITKNLALRAGSQYDFGFSDNWDKFVSGKRKDMGVRVGLGLNLYFGSKPIKN
ncbi:curli production assembly protein CsgG [Kaistella daneshvariae]|uniref:Curli production assembly protein CsgG n=1 Tax=Kaistella daneshvariae TaxID=2487074 RepID=A0ABN5T3N2_9FLAO|nr:CsgG/HfaB family protein [Kaistella daneshvariae]AZI68040.1 curli production assembly protein CsgG [Kaistella daneshvariae]